MRNKHETTMSVGQALAALALLWFSEIWIRGAWIEIKWLAGLVSSVF